MSQKLALGKYDAINNRVLVRNSHKFVYKKLCNINRDQWCQKYLSVATSKLLDPKSTFKLPFSLNKRIKTQQVNPSSTLSNFVVKRRKSQVLAIHENEQVDKSRTIDDDELLKANRRAQRLLQRMKRTVIRPAFGKNNRSASRSHIKLRNTRSKDQFDIEPWLVDKQDQDDKQNRFF